MCEHHHHHHHVHPEPKHIPLRLLTGLILLTGATIIPIFPIKLTFYVASYLISGFEVIATAFNNIRKGEFFDENFLMTIATLGAFAIKEYPEAVMVIILYQVGEYLQDKAVEKSKKSISELMNIRPDYATVKRNGEFIKEKPENIAINDIILVKTGEKIPLDGVIIDGHAAVNTAAITGEFVPKYLRFGDTAISGCINTNGVLKIRVTKEYKESTVSKILELIEYAGSKKTQTEKFITKFAKIYTPIVVFCAVLLAAIPPIFMGAELGVWFARALTFLVISCPCALVISVPLGFFAGIGCASRNGILIKGSKYIEKLANPQIIAFDKTGTLTCGTFSVKSVYPQKGITKDEILKTATSAEYYSNHPIAVSIKTSCSEAQSIPQNTEEIAGKGIKSQIGENIILVGNRKLMSDYGICVPENKEFGSIAYVAKNNQYLGYILITDELKPNTESAIKNLKKLNIQTAMLTGDIKKNADYIGTELNINEIYSELLPENKADLIQTFITKKIQGKNIIFVGDGINDAPVLTLADIGISMGGLGSEAAIEASDIVILDDNLLKIPTAIKIARKTITIAKQNIILAIGIKVLFLGLGTIGLITLWGAVFADVGVTLLAVLNSLRGLYIKPIVH